MFIGLLIFAVELLNTLPTIDTLIADALPFASTSSLKPGCRGLVSHQSSADKNPEGRRMMDACGRLADAVLYPYFIGRKTSKCILPREP